MLPLNGGACRFCELLFIVLFCRKITIIVDVYINAFFNVGRVKGFKASFAIGASGFLVGIGGYVNICGFIISKNSYINVRSFIAVKSGYIKIYSFIKASVIRGSYADICNAGKKRKWKT